MMMILQVVVMIATWKIQSRKLSKMILEKLYKLTKHSTETVYL